MKRAATCQLDSGTNKLHSSSGTESPTDGGGAGGHGTNHPIGMEPIEQTDSKNLSPLF